MRINKGIRKILFIDTIVIACIFVFLLLTNKTLVLYNDQIFQYDIFYETWANMLYRFFTTGEFPFYSFNTYLGSDFYSSMLYYCTGNIFFPLMILFRNNIRIYVVIEFALCIYISSLTMYLFLKEEKIENEKVLLYASLMYSFSGFALINTGNYMFMRFYAFFPLALLGISKIINNKGILLFTISVAILFAQSYYLMWPASIMLILYYIYRTSFSRFNIKLFFKTFLSFLLGVGLVSFLLLPGIMFIINNSRIGANHSTQFTFSINTILLYIQDFIVPNISQMTSTLLKSDNPENYHIYASSLTLGIIPLLTASSYIKENIKSTFIFCILLFGYVLTSISSILHGFSMPSFRWIFVLIPIILLFSSKHLNSKGMINNKIAILYIIILFISFILVLLLNKSSSNKVDLIIHVVYCILNIGLILLYFQNEYLSILLTNVLYIFTYIFIIVCSCFVSQGYTNTFDSYTIKSLSDNNNDFIYRIYAPYQIYHYNSILQLNESMREGFMSTSTYSSVVDPALNEFHNVIKQNNWIIQNDDENVLSMLGVKYYILPSNKKVDVNKYEQVGYMNGEYPIYQSSMYDGFAKTYGKIDYISNYKNTQDFLSTLFVDEKDFDIFNYVNLEKQVLNIYEKSENYLIGEIDLHSNNILFIPVPNNNGWKIYDNGNVIKSINVNGGFIGIPLTSGEHTIKMYFTPYMFKEGVIVSLFSLVLLLIINKRMKS